jgi:adenine/guanine/hypoxanthine permease
VQGGVLPPWVTRAAKGKRQFWKADEEPEPIQGTDTDSHSGQPAKAEPPTETMEKKPSSDEEPEKKPTVVA